MVVLSLDGLVKSLNKHLKENGAEIIVKLLLDIDYPDYYKITIERI